MSADFVFTLAYLGRSAPILLMDRLAVVDLLSLKQAFPSYPKAIGLGGIEFALTCELTRLIV